MSNARIEGILSIVAALLVLFTTMLDPMLSVALATTLLVAFGLHRLLTGGCSPASNGQQGVSADQAGSPE